jgi:hypothetical protein
MGLLAHASLEKEYRLSIRRGSQKSGVCVGNPEKSKSKIRTEKEGAGKYAGPASKGSKG